MLGFFGSSYALFAAVWGIMCVLSGAVVTDSMLRNVPTPSVFDMEQADDGPAADA